MLKLAFNIECSLSIYVCIDNETLSYVKESGENMKWPFNCFCFIMQSLSIPGQTFLSSAASAL